MIISNILLQQYQSYVWIADIALLALLIAIVILWFSVQKRQKIQASLDKERQENERSRFFLESVLNELPIPASVKDVNSGTQYMFWNKEAQRMFGTSAERLIGKSGYPFLEEESAEQMSKLNDEVIKTGIRGRAIIDTKIKSNGTRRLLVINKSIVSYNNEQQWLITSVEDITEIEMQKEKLQEINDRYEIMLHATQQMPWTWDLKKGVMNCDVSYDEILKRHYGPVGLSITQKNFSSFIFPDDVERMSNTITEVKAGERLMLQDEYKLSQPTGANGEPLWIETYGIVSKRDEDGNPEQMVGAFRQITQNKQLQLELRNAKHKAEESNRLKSSFLANMSHEIRTPLNAIVGFSGILANTDDEEDKKEFINIIDYNNKLLLQLINDILDLSKIEAGTLDFHYANTDINLILSELETSFRIRCTDKVNISFAEKPDKCVIYTDKNRLLQVIINFITNAIKFTPAGSIRFGYRMQDEDTLYFYVSDTGCGISEENQKQIFGRFVKLNSYAQGTGLGLAISEMIINKMGGEIGVKSTLGEGSTFWFTLPYKSVQETYAKVADIEQNHEIIVLDKNENIKILIAEDNESHYKLLESILKKKYTLIHAWNGQEAVDLFRQQRPHLVLMDINLPVINGYEAVSQIRRQSGSVPIIAVTVFTYSEDAVKVIEAGFNDYVAKPIDTSALQDKVAAYIKQTYLDKSE